MPPGLFVMIKEGYKKEKALIALLLFQYEMLFFYLNCFECNENYFYRHGDLEPGSCKESKLQEVRAKNALPAYSVLIECKLLSSIQLHCRKVKAVSKKMKRSHLKISLKEEEKALKLIKTVLNDKKFKKEFYLHPLIFVYFFSLKKKYTAAYITKFKYTFISQACITF